MQDNIQTFVKYTYIFTIIFLLIITYGAKY